ncbi:MAG: NACHT domain-containing protein [Candidatus Obscuribacterales bacterium]|jgi:hypothetical protein
METEHFKWLKANELIATVFLFVFIALAVFAVEARAKKKNKINLKFRLKLPFADIDLEQDKTFTQAAPLLVEKYASILKSAIESDNYKASNTHLKLPYDLTNNCSATPIKSLSQKQTLFEQALEYPFAITLLITGPLGSGKSTTLHDIASQIISNPPNSEIPVILQATGWKKDYRSLSEFVAGQLASAFRVPSSVSLQLLDNERLALLIDGLDELAPTKQIQFSAAIKEFIDTHGSTILIACCRDESTVPYLHIQFARHARLDILSEASVDAYIAGEQLYSLRNLLKIDTDLQNLAKTPLFLYFICESLGLKTSDDINTFTAAAKKDLAVRTFLINKVGAIDKYTFKQNVKYLKWLALQLDKFEKVEFYVDELQPEWLPNSISRMAYLLGSATFVTFLSLPLLALLFSTMIVTKQSCPLEAVLILPILIGLFAAITNYHVNPFSKIDFVLSKLNLTFWWEFFLELTNWIFATLAIMFATFALFAILFTLQEPYNIPDWITFCELMSIGSFCFLTWHYLSQNLGIQPSMGLITSVLTPFLIGGVAVPALFLGCPIAAHATDLDEYLPFTIMTIPVLFCGICEVLIFKTSTRIKRFQRLFLAVSVTGLLLLPFLLVVLIFEDDLATPYLSAAVTRLKNGDFAALGIIATELIANAQGETHLFKPLRDALTSILATGASLWGVCFVVQHMRGPVDFRDEIPNHGILKTIKNSLYCSLTGITAILLVGLVFKILRAGVEYFWPGVWPVASIGNPNFETLYVLGGYSIGATIGIVSALLPAAQHYLIRWLLYSHRLIPVRLVDFLDRCVTNRLLIRTGGGYRFCHLFIKEYLQKYDEQLLSEID